MHLLFFKTNAIFRRDYEYAALTAALLTVGRKNAASWLVYVCTFNTYSDLLNSFCASTVLDGTIPLLFMLKKHMMRTKRVNFSIRFLNN